MLQLQKRKIPNFKRYLNYRDFVNYFRDKEQRYFVLECMVINFRFVVTTLCLTGKIYF